MELGRGGTHKNGEKRVQKLGFFVKHHSNAFCQNHLHPPFYDFRGFNKPQGSRNKVWEGVEHLGLLGKGLGFHLFLEKVIKLDANQIFCQVRWGAWLFVCFVCKVYKLS